MSPGIFGVSFREYTALKGTEMSWSSFPGLGLPRTLSTGSQGRRKVTSSMPPPHLSNSSMKKAFRQCLDQVLNISTSAALIPDLAPLAELDRPYLQILSPCQTSKLPMLKRVLGYVMLPPFLDIAILTVAKIETLLCLSRGQVKLILRGLRSLVSFENGRTGICSFT